MTLTDLLLGETFGEVNAIRDPVSDDRPPLTAAIFWNEDQPRDDHGRWTSDGGSGGAESKEVTTINGMSADAYIASKPQQPGEATFEWQARLVKGLDRETQSELLYRTRETYPPVDFCKDGAARWCDGVGTTPPPDDVNERKADLDEADAVGRYIEQTPDQSNDPMVRVAYEDFRRQSDAQWDFMTRPVSEGGMGVTVTFTNEKDPYSSATAQAEDLRQNRHITIESGLGGHHESTMTVEEYDRFRAVHDVFGHAGVGGGFDRHGEYQAWLMHASMYTGLGRDAMSTEYHGINSALWSGDPNNPGGTGKSILLPDQWSDPPWDRED